MKAKLFFILLATLFIVPVNAIILETQSYKFRCKAYYKKIKLTTRCPYVFDIDVQEADGYLQIIFPSPLSDVEITITDKDGNVVVHEPQVFIHEGKTLYIHSPNDYPYTVKITSTTVDIIGEIIEVETE